MGIAKSDPNSAARRSALVQLRDMRSDKLRPILLHILQTEMRNENLRETALKALGEVGREGDLELLRKIANGETKEFARFGRAAAQKAYARLATTSAFVGVRREQGGVVPLEARLEEAMRESYRQAGVQAGYWGRRFLQAVNKNGGLPTAKRMLEPRNASQRKGLDALLAAGKPELTFEAVVLRPEFRSLFTVEERAEAQARLGKFKLDAKEYAREHELLYPDELDPRQQYPEGAKKQVRVNAYERNPKARNACLKHYGRRCSACGLLFSERYGAIGERFIHVHHRRLVSTVGKDYRVDPVEDLVPVCPNCHAMLHQPPSVRTVEELRAILAETASRDLGKHSL